MLLSGWRRRLPPTFKVKKETCVNLYHILKSIKLCDGTQCIWTMDFFVVTNLLWYLQSSLNLNSTPQCLCESR